MLSLKTKPLETSVPFTHTVAAHTLVSCFKLLLCSTFFCIHLCTLFGAFGHLKDILNYILNAQPCCESVCMMSRSEWSSQQQCEGHVKRYSCMQYKTFEIQLTIQLLFQPCSWLLKHTFEIYLLNSSIFIDTRNSYYNWTLTGFQGIAIWSVCVPWSAYLTSCIPFS